MMDAPHIFEDAIDWLRDNYASFGFVVERDVVWTLQKRLKEAIHRDGLSYKVFNDYPMLPGKRRALSADLVIVDPSGNVEVATEFKFEPSHRRRDILPNKLPVVFWGAEGVAKDVLRTREFVEQGKAQVAYSVFIDEGGYFRHREPYPGSVWNDWGDCGNPQLDVSVLWSRVSA